MIRELAFRVYKIVGWTIIGFALTVTLLRTITPYLLPTGPQLSKWVADALHYPARIDKILVTWEGFTPVITLTKLQVFSTDMQPAFYARRMKLLLNVPYLLFRRTQIEEIVLEGATTGIEYQTPNRLRVVGLPEFQFDLQNSSSSSLPRPKRIVVNQSRVNLKINQTQEAHLTSVRLGIEGNQLVKIRGEATIFEAGEAKVKFAADLPTAKHAAATLFCEGQGVSLSWIATLLPKQFITFQNGLLDYKLWIKIKDRKHLDLTTQLTAKDVLLAHPTQRSISHSLLKGTLKIQRANQRWKMIGSEWMVDEKDPIDFMVKMVPDLAESEYELVAHHLNLVMLQEWLKRIDHLPEKVTTLIENYPASGTLSSLHVMGKKTEKAFVPTFASITFKDLQLQDKALAANIYPLAGTLYYDNAGGQIVIQGDNVSINYPSYFENSLSLTNVKADLFWKNQPHLKIQIAALQGFIADTPLKGKGSLQLYHDKRPDIELLLEIGALNTGKALALFPRKIMDKDLIEWLDHAIEGEAIATGIVLRGNVADFPFDKTEGIFEAYTHLNQAHLHYASDWPALSDLNADLLFHNRDLTITSEKGKIKQGTLISAIAQIPDLSASPAELTVDAAVADRLENGMVILQQSPLHTTAKNLAPFLMKGPMTLDLHLQIPLAKGGEVKVKGGIKVTDSTFAAPSWDLTIDKLIGEVFFTEQAVYADKLQGKLFGSTSQFQVESIYASEPYLRVTAIGRTDPEQLKQWLKWTHVNTISGETDYTAQLTFITGSNPRLININASSSLLGIALNLPFPLTKLESTLRPLSVDLHFVSDHLLHVTGQYGDDLHAAVTLALKDPQWEATGAHVYLGGKRMVNFREDNKLLIEGELNQLSFQQWKEFLLPFKNVLREGVSLEPSIILSVGTFDLFGLIFSKTNIQANWQDHIWQAHFDGPSLKGDLILPEAEEDVISIHLQKLALAKSDEFSYLSSTNERWAAHPINVKIQEFIVDQKTFYDLQARLEPSWKGYLFRDVKAKMKGTELQLSGNWDYLSSDKKVSAEGNIFTQNISETLSSLGINGTLHNANGEAIFSLQWNGSPAKIDYASLSGSAEFTLANGTVQGVNPGIGRILSLLNINQVARRLSFDFSDVTNKGFAFDNLHGKLQFGRGKISSNKVTLSGPSANIEAFGQASLENQGLDGEMVVMPNVTGSLPLAAAIAAGNPAVGAAVWVADKMVGKKIQEINRFRYKVLGTWQEPLVKEVPSVALSYRR